MKNTLLLLLVLFFISVKSLFAHSVQVAYCISCDGQLRLYVEHWHGAASPTSTTMTLEVTVDGVTTASTGSPVDNLQDIPFAQLPNCASPPVVFASCPDKANTYNDWVVYDFQGIPDNSTAKIKIISGNSAFTDDGCGMFPAETNNFVVSPINQPPITVASTSLCSGTASNPIIFPPGNPSGGTYIWSNDNTNTGIPATGSGDIPSFTPPASTTTEVSTITVSYLCATTTFTVTVLPSAGPDFNYVNIQNSSSNGADPNIQCLGDSTQFQAQTEPGVTIQSVLWDFGDGTTSTERDPQHLFQNNGTYNVSLQITTTDGCIQTSSSFITVNPKPVASYTSNPECEYNAVDFSSTSTVSIGAIVSWNWSFGDGNTSNLENPSNLYATNGSYPIGLAVVTDEGCVGTAIGTQVVYKKPFASFNANAACSSKATNFSDASTSSNSITNYSWDYENDGTIDNSTSNPSYIYPTIGNFDVHLIVEDANGCIDDTISNVIVNALPVVDFTTTTVCPNFATDLTDITTVAGTATIANKFWDFGNDGSVDATTQNAQKLWSAGGNYDVELRIISTDGCEDSVVHSVLVYPKPIAEFTNTTVCFGTTTNFTDNSTVGMSNTVSIWDWDFDDLNTSMIQNPTNDYLAHGLYDVTLMIETNNGCRDTITKEVEVYSQPVIDFNMQNVCEYESVTFVNNTTIPGGDNMTYLWSFGDNSTLSVESPSHLYSTEGVYSVNLEATSINGCVSDSTIDVEIYDEPSAQFALTNDCVYESFTFTDYSITTSTIDTWDWDYSEGNTSAQQSPTHTFNSEGVYPIRLIVTTTEQCKDTATIDLEVYPKPVANFTPNYVCLNVSTEFQDISTVSTQVFSNESILPYSSWSFGDASVASGPSVNHTYSMAGSYNAQIIVTTNHNCKDTLETIVLAHSNPVASFVTSDSVGCSPVTANFINTSTIDNNPQNYTLTYQWYLDNDTENNNENVTSIFTNTSNIDNEFYGASLVVTSNLGCKDSVYIADGVTVHPIPLTDFSFAPEETNVYNTLIDFTDLSVIATNWSWDLGDGTLDNVQHPSHRYADSGTYNVQLIIQNQYSCVDSISKLVRIDPVFEVFIPNSITPNADGRNDVFMVDGYGITEQDLYIYDKWGQLLFEGNNVGDSWDGFVNDEQYKTAVYVYVVNIVDLYGESHNYKGSVTVVR